MGTIFATAQKWQLRATLVIIGIMTWIFGICIIIGYTATLLGDLAWLYTRGAIWQASGERNYIITVLSTSIDAGLLGICDFTIWPRPKPGQTQPPGATTVLVPAFPQAVNQASCEMSVEKERAWQYSQLHKDKWDIYADVEHRIQAVFIGLDILMILLGCLAGIIGYLLILGAFRKRRKFLVPWLLLSFTIALGAMMYGIIHVIMKGSYGSMNFLALASTVAIAIIVLVLHGAAFYAVAKYFLYLWRSEGRPDFPVRRMRLILSRK